jgi:hypothetical protein
LWVYVVAWAIYWGYTYGMTMKREAKVEVTGKYELRKTGEVAEPSRSPRQYAAYGAYLPATVAARFFLGYERYATARTRDDWATSRILFREPTRARVLHLPSTYRPRHSA